MKAWLAVNSFLYTEKFREIYALLINAAKIFGVDLKEMMYTDIYRTNERPSFVLFWDKDIFLAKKLEDMGIKIFNSSDAVKICDSKAETARQLSVNDVPAPETLIAPKAYPATGYGTYDFITLAAERLGFPLVIKESCGSFGQQVYLAHNIDDAKRIISTLQNREFIFQKFIEESTGRDIRINVIGDRVVSAMKRINSCDFRSNITSGGRAFETALTEEQKKLAVAAAKAAGCDFAGVDIFDTETPMVCEINASPHFKSSIDCNGIDIAKLLIEYVLEKI